MEKINVHPAVLIIMTLSCVISSKKLDLFASSESKGIGSHKQTGDHGDSNALTNTNKVLLYSDPYPFWQKHMLLEVKDGHENNTVQEINRRKRSSRAVVSTKSIVNNNKTANLKPRKTHTGPSVTGRKWPTTGTADDKNLAHSINRPLTFRGVLNDDSHQRDTRALKTGNQSTRSAANELKNKELLDERRPRWNIDALQLWGIKELSKRRSLTPSGLHSTTKPVSSVTERGDATLSLDSYDKLYFHENDALFPTVDAVDDDEISVPTINEFGNSFVSQFRSDDLISDTFVDYLEGDGVFRHQVLKGKQTNGVKTSDREDFFKRKIKAERNIQKDESIDRDKIEQTAGHRNYSLSKTEVKSDTITDVNYVDENIVRPVIIDIHKRDTNASEKKLALRKRALPSLEEVYKKLTTLDVVFFMPLNMSLNATDSNTTSDGQEKCMALLNELFRDVKDNGQVYCNSSWDEVSCWPRTLAGTIASVPCPGYLTGIKDSNNATKMCYENGTWADKAAYDFCLGSEDSAVKPDEDHSTAIRVIYDVGFTVSTLTLAIALFIFLFFRSLRCLRNLIHCHLIVTFILSNIVWIIVRHSLIYMQSPSISWLCKTLISMYRFSHSTNFFWMFVEGLYLHIIIVWTYSADKIKLRYLVVIGWGCPAINLLVWITLRLEFANDQCWLPTVDDISEYDFAMIGPILLVLLANIIFLSTIVWVLITKLRASHTLETRQYRKAVRATVILFPLLGITYVLFITPPSDHPQVKIVFKYINAVLQSFQGLLVAIFYCFLNGEVKSVLKKKLSRYTDARNLSTKYTKTSVVGYSTAYGNGAIDQKRRLNGSNSNPQQPESIPLTDTRLTMEINDS